ncbi:MAG: hypothetical protein GX446_03190 [Chthonomonadales bacterium]|nr:hypothetical protein [Chthonomonadales bacterium]
MIATLIAGSIAVVTSMPQRSVVVTRAVIVTHPQATAVERVAARMLREEANKRGASWSLATAPASAAVTVHLGSTARPPAGVPSSVLKSPSGSEGYTLRVSADGRRVTIYAIGRDERGCMYAAGRLLRSLQWGSGSVMLPTMSVSTAPHKPMRGHQLGWRATANSYDRWGLREFEQYIRDLIVWGTNAIELIPFEDTYDREKNLRFTCALADLIASYGLDVWLWYPVAETVPEGATGPGLIPGELPCPSQPAGRAFILEHRRELFRRMKHLDGLLIPGGDPAGCRCDRCTPWVDTLLPLAAEIASDLRKYHPKAGVWLSNQGFLHEHNDRFYAFLRQKQPAWLTGVVHAPWVEETVESMRARTPARYPIRQYPDICHCVRCQYPVVDWDNAFAATLGREPVIYRPEEHAHIARRYQGQTVGAITYSDGVTDDLNKVMWSAVLWDPKREAGDVLAEYARFFFGSRAAPDAVRGIRGLEANWRGPVLKNRGIERTFELWARLEKSYPNLARGNWRFQMALLRAYYDRYVQIKLQHETEDEAAALSALKARMTSPIEAARQAITMLDAMDSREHAPSTRVRLLRLGQELFDSIGLQLSVPRWGASGSERGAVLDFLDAPLRNQDWIRAELRRAVETSDPSQVRAAIERVVGWEDPGPGGFYDDLGDPDRQPHLVRGKTWKEDPGYVESTRTDFAKYEPGYRQSWIHYAESLYGAPIIMRYTGLDPSASYVVRATYSGRYRPTMTLKADDRYDVHGPVATETPPVTREWPVPREATSDGVLTLRWERTAGRGAQVAEVWLIRK